MIPAQAARQSASFEIFECGSFSISAWFTFQGQAIKKLVTLTKHVILAVTEDLTLRAINLYQQKVAC